MNNFLSKRGIRLKLNARIYLGIGLLLLLLLQSVASFAQKITLNYRNVPLEHVLKEIRKQSGYDIFFDQKLVTEQPLVIVKVTNANVEEALSTALKGLSLSYAVNGRTISIKKPDKIAGPETRQKKITITGTVIDENGLPKSGVSISANNLKSIYTDGEGKFILKDIDPLAMVRIAYTGYHTVERTALAISLMGEIPMETEAINLNTTIIQGQKIPGTAIINKVELSKRRHLTLGFVLESTIPGLVLKKQVSSSKTEIYRSDGTNPLFPAGDFTFEELSKVVAKMLLSTIGVSDPNTIKQATASFFEQGRREGKVISQTSINDSGVIPELRGAGGFGVGNNAMLVVIDGFVQNSFPADYPLNNVLSIEVIRDPAETIKWGPGASNGVIIITTNGGKSGQLQINYNSTFNFSGSPDNSASALQRANTSELLDYYLEENNRLPTGFKRPDPNTALLTPARALLEKRYRNQITATEFQSSWNLLSQLSNEAQYREQQQNIFNQTQNLNLSGGGKHHRFSLNGSYSTSRTEALGNNRRNWGINFRDQLSLLNNKLQIALQLNANLDKSVAGKVLNSKELDPYQMLYRANGSYVYDYVIGGVNENRNKQLKTTYSGLQDYGYNPLQEARGTSDLNKVHQLHSSLNVNWKLLDGLTWSTNLQYTNSNNNIEKLWAANTQYARSLYNSYYAVSQMEEIMPGFFRANPLNSPVAYMPSGDIFQRSNRRSSAENLRTGLNYNGVFGQKHALNTGFGLAYFNKLYRSTTNLPLYGYNSGTGLGTALSLPNAEQSYSNPLGLINFDRLTALMPINYQPERNFSTNASLNYTYDGRLGLQAFYNESFMPVTTMDIYSSTRNYNALASWALHKESFFKVPLVSKLKLSAGLGEIKMASLPVNLPAVRSFNANWGTSLLVTAYNPVRQNGEQIRNYDALLDMGLFKDLLQGQLNYRYNSMGVKNQLSGRLSYHISKAGYFKVPWVSNLMVEGLVSNISPAQALAQMMSTNSPLPDGGFSVATSNFDLGSLPPHIVNREISLRFGLWKNSLNADVRYYNRSTSGIVNGTFQTDLSTGFEQRPVYSRINNKGYELYVQAKILEGDGFTWTSTLNGAYNSSEVRDVIKPIYDNNLAYLNADRTGYAIGSLWSYRWAGLSNKGNPQIYGPEGDTKVIDVSSLQLDENWITYSGRTTPPWSGAFIQEFGYKGFYARTTLRFALGHVMRTYRPDMMAYRLERSNLIAKRWRKPGDEAFTDIPSIGFDPYLDIRDFFTKNSSNSIAPADFLRLSEIQFGYDVPVKWLKGRYVKSLNLALNLQNVALWTRNKLGIDPEAIMINGQLLPRQPLRYGIALNVGL